jgi:hypothetical protein
MQQAVNETSNNYLVLDPKVLSRPIQQMPLDQFSRKHNSIYRQVHPWTCCTVVPTLEAFRRWCLSIFRAKSLAHPNCCMLLAQMHSLFLYYSVILFYYFKYNGPLTFELNSFPRAGRNSSWSYVKTIFSIRNNENTHNAFRNSQSTPYLTFS